MSFTRARCGESPLPSESETVCDGLSTHFVVLVWIEIEVLEDPGLVPHEKTNMKNSATIPTPSRTSIPARIARNGASFMASVSCD
jgi:hypothetical protein